MSYDCNVQEQPEDIQADSCHNILLVNMCKCHLNSAILRQEFVDLSAFIDSAMELKTFVGKQHLRCPGSMSVQFMWDLWWTRFSRLLPVNTVPKIYSVARQPAGIKQAHFAVAVPRDSVQQHPTVNQFKYIQGEFTLKRHSPKAAYKLRTSKKKR